MITLIDQLAQNEEQKAREAEESRRQEIKRKAEETRVRFIEWMGRDLYDLLSPKAKEKTREQSGYAVIEWTLDIDHDLQLAPMQILFSNYTRSWCWTKTAGYTIGDDPQRGVVVARRNYQEYADREQKERLESLVRQIRKYQDDPDAMNQAYAALNSEFPERSDEWEKARKEWIEYHDEIEQSRSREKAEREDYDKRCGEYETALRKFYTDLDRIYEENVKLLSQVQAEHNQPYTVYRLRYALVASDEEGDRFIEERSFYVKGDVRPDGYFESTDGRLVMLFHPISIEPVEVVPTDQIPGVIGIAVFGDNVLYFKPDTSPETINQAIKGFVPLPEEPNSSDYGMSYESISSIKRKINGTDGSYY